MEKRNGKTAAITGSRWYPWGHLTGTNYSCQGNILASREPVEAMASAFENTEGDLADRLAATLESGQTAGRDSRSRQSAALLMARREDTAGLPTAALAAAQMTASIP